MLSENLAALAARLREYEHTGMELAPTAVAALCAALDAAVEDARALERHTVPAPARVTRYSGNVVPWRGKIDPGHDGAAA